MFIILFYMATRLNEKAETWKKWKKMFQQYLYTEAVPSVPVQQTFSQRTLCKYLISNPTKYQSEQDF